jgi:hypothetical protein
VCGKYTIRSSKGATNWQSKPFNTNRTIQLPYTKRSLHAAHLFGRQTSKAEHAYLLGDERPVLVRPLGLQGAALSSLHHGAIRECQLNGSRALAGLFAPATATHANHVLHAD